MQKSVRHTILLCVSITIILLVIQGCKKSTDPTGKSKTNLITQASWKISKYEIKTGSGAWNDVTGSLQPCDKDNVFIFSTNSVFEENEGATKCNIGDPQIIITGNWSFGSNETQLNLTPTGFPAPFKTESLDQLDESVLMTTYNYSSGGTVYYERRTYGH